MKRESLTQYDILPEDMLMYLRNYGPHFNKKLCEFAAEHMYKKEGNSERRITGMSKEEVKNILSRHNVVVERSQLHDCVYVANMCVADFLNSSIPDERHLALYIKDIIDDVDAPDGLLFNRFYADCCYKGIVIDWEDMI